jgi:hypothetical protein
LDIFTRKLEDASSASAFGGLLTLAIPLAVLAYTIALIVQFTQRDVVAQTEIVNLDQLSSIPYAPFRCLSQWGCTIFYLNAALPKYDASVVLVPQPNGVPFGSVNTSAFPTPLPTCAGMTQQLFEFEEERMIPVCADGFSVLNGGGRLTQQTVANYPAQNGMRSFDANHTWTDALGNYSLSFSATGTCACKLFYNTTWNALRDVTYSASLPFMYCGALPFLDPRIPLSIFSAPSCTFGSIAIDSSGPPHPTKWQFSLSLRESVSGAISASVAAMRDTSDVVSPHFGILHSVVCPHSSFPVAAPWSASGSTLPFAPVVFYPQSTFVLFTTESRPGNWISLLGQIGGSIGLMHSACVGIMWLYRQSAYRKRGPDPPTAAAAHAAAEAAESDKAALEMNPVSLSDAGRLD